MAIEEWDFHRFSSLYSSVKDEKPIKDLTGAESGPNLDQNGTILFHGDSGQGSIW